MTSLQLVEKAFSASRETVEKVARWPFLHPEGVQWYSERVKKGQIYVKAVEIRCFNGF